MIKVFFNSPSVINAISRFFFHLIPIFDNIELWFVNYNYFHTCLKDLISNQLTCINYFIFEHLTKTFFMKKLILLFAVFALIGISSIYAQNVRINGAVTGANDGQPLAGATIMVKGTNIGIVADLNGQYTISVPQSATTLIFSFLGYNSREVLIGGRTTINVQLELDATRLDEVIIVGYGTTRNISTVIGSVSRVTSEKIESKPSANVLDAMQGRVAGLQVYTSSGEPSTLSSIRLHGVGSLGASSNPLYVIDGIPVDNSSVLTLNPNDFESVNVLKDASATSIYGSRAANGVIYITTKKGKFGAKSIIRVNTQYGVSNIANTDYFNSLMNSQELADFWVAVGYRTQAQADALLALGNDTKWYQHYYKRDTPTKQTDISVSGGSDKTRYFISGGYYHQDGIAIRSSYERYSARANVDSRATQWLNIGANVGLSYDDRETNPYGTNSTNRGLAILAPPFYTPYDENGNLYRGVIPGWGRYEPNYMLEKQPFDGNRSSINLSAFVQINPLKGLTIKSQAGLDGYTYRQASYILPSYLASANNGSVATQADISFLKTITNTIEYKFDIKDNHQFILLGGQEYVDSYTNSITASSSGHTDDRLMLLSAGPNNRNVGETTSEYAFQSYFGRLDYSYNQKYYFDVSVRQDASSRFGKNNNTAVFWAAGAMWNLKKEPFLSDVKFITSMNLKFSYGTSGNSDIGDYTHLATIGTSNYDSQSAWAISTPGNPSLMWEKQRKMTLGLRFELFSKMRFNLEYYDRATSNQLISVPQPYTTGFDNITENVGTIANKGIDLEFDFDLIKNNDLYLTPRIVLNYNWNKITDLFQGRDHWIIPNTGVAWVLNQPVRFYRPMFAGVDPADGSAMWYLTGESRNVTTKNETTKTFNAQNLEQNTGLPRYAPFAGGLGIDAGWKGLEVSCDFTFVKDKFLFNNDAYFINNPSVFAGFNQQRRILDYWKNPGDVTTYPRYGVQFTQFDSSLIEDASFIRLKNLSVAYNLPKSILSKTKFIEGLKIYFTGRNLFTSTKYSGVDPEVDSNLSLGAYPNTKEITFGLSVTL